MRILRYIIIIFTAAAGLYSCGSASKMTISKAPYKRTTGGISYKILKDSVGKRYSSVGDYVIYHTIIQYEDSILINSYTQTIGHFSTGLPYEVEIKEPSYNGDLLEILTMMTPGDSGIFIIPTDTLLNSRNDIYKWLEPGKEIRYSLKLEEILSSEEMLTRWVSRAPTQKQKDDILLKHYFLSHNVNPILDSSGLYYTVTHTTAAPALLAGQRVSVNYSGRLIDGTLFDSNTDSTFNHVEPFTFELGKGQVIKGWDIGVSKMNLGEKATFYIPSRLAYGSRSPIPEIPPHSILIFNVAIIDTNF